VILITSPTADFRSDQQPTTVAPRGDEVLEVGGLEMLNSLLGDERKVGQPVWFD
jgi:hypothetical protein